MDDSRGNPPAAAPVLVCGRHRLVLDRPRVMAVVNITPDSFSDAGRYATLDAAIARAHAFLDDGADILDIGGESTRPGAQPVAEADERQRVLPLIESLRAECDARGIPISIDSRKPGVMRAAIAAGASMVNDVGALRAPGALQAVNDTSTPIGICLMHMRGEPATMQRDATYEDVVDEVTGFLRDRIAACVAAGIAQERIVIDPGFGFGKTVDHNLILLRQLERIVAIGMPVLVGISRKSTLGVLTGRAVDDRIAASVAAALAAVARGAAIVRVHDVRETVDALKVWQAVMHE